MTINNIENQT